MVAWMVFASVTGCALTVTAIAADRIASLGRYPHRLVWLTAMLVTICWPVITLARSVVLSSRNSSSSSAIVLSGVHRLSAFVVSAPAWSFSARWNPVIIVGWGAVSTLLIARLLLAIRRIRRRQAAWRSIEIDGLTVHVAGNAGPAVVGLRPMHVVVPEWVVGLNRPQRELVLRHESEHQSARDPYLLLCAALLTALFPWNLALWFQARRLRLAIEIDCDSRVLRSHSHWREYALLLLTIAQRQSGAPPLIAPALSEPASNLERRINAMRSSPVLSPFRAILLGLAGSAAFVLACAVHTPDSPDRSNRTFSVTVPNSRVNELQQNLNPDADTFFEFQVEKPAVERMTSRIAYPAAMKQSRINGDVIAQFVVTKAGQVDMQTFKALTTSGPEFTAAVKAALLTWKFDPAEVGGRKVSQVVQQAFEFRVPPSN